MAITGFFHGTETQYLDTVPRTVQTVSSNVVFLVGAAPIYKASDSAGVNTPVLTINNVEDIEAFGVKTPGFNIPYWLDILRDNNAGQIITINVFDPATDTATDEDEEYTFPTSGASLNVIQLKRGGASGTANAENLTSVSVTNTAGSTTYTVTTDYTVDATNGTITRVASGAITAGQAIAATYTYADPSAVTTSDVIGTVTGSTRTGLEAIADCWDRFGVTAKLILCLHADTSAVCTEMVAKAELYDAIAYLDGTISATRAQLLAGRNGTSPMAHFQQSSDRAYLWANWGINSDSVDIPASVYGAAATCYTDREFGYWWSPSNKPVQNITGRKLQFTSNFRDPNTDANLLNAQAISTITADRGGFRTWGNRSAAYPASSTPLTFIAVRRNLDITLESAALATRDFIDRPIDDKLIDQVLDTLNGYVRDRVIVGAMQEGSRFYYDSSQNPALQLAAGKIVFSYEFGFPTPAEWLILRGTIDITLFNSLGSTN